MLGNKKISYDNFKHINPPEVFKQQIKSILKKHGATVTIEDVFNIYDALLAMGAEEIEWFKRIFLRASHERSEELLGFLLGNLLHQYIKTRKILGFHFKFPQCIQEVDSVFQPLVHYPDALKQSHHEKGFKRNILLSEINNETLISFPVLRALEKEGASLNVEQDEFEDVLSRRYWCLEDYNLLTRLPVSYSCIKKLYGLSLSYEVENTCSFGYGNSSANYCLEKARGIATRWKEVTNALSLTRRACEEIVYKALANRMAFYIRPYNSL